MNFILWKVGTAATAAVLILFYTNYYMSFNEYNKSRQKDWLCEECKQTFKTRAEYRQHRKDVEHKSPMSRPSIKWICEYCGRERTSPKASQTLHKKYCLANPNHIICEGHKVSEETKKKISSTGKSRQSLGGYRFGSGRGKKGTYKGYYCDSSWELAYVIFNIEHNIKFERNEKLFPYEFNGEQHRYKPDFIEGDTYVEVKGYYTEQVEAKTKAFPYKLKFLDKKTIKPYIDYVISKYGQDYIRLYE